MGSLQDIKKRFEALQGNELPLAVEAIQDNEEVITDLVAGQLAQGIKSDGTSANFTYTPFTIARKKNNTGLAAVTNRLTNFETGESYRKLYVKAGISQIEFGTKTDKEDAISDRMDGRAFEPDNENKTELIRQHVQPVYNKKIKDFLGL